MALKVQGTLRREAERNLRLVRGLARLAVKGNARTVHDMKVWMFGAFSGKRFADNSAALFRYVVQNHPEIDARWVISRDSPDVPLVRQHGEVLFAEDPDTYAHGMLAAVHVISHGAHDVPGCASRWSHAFKVRLGHGLTALKRKAPHRFRARTLDSIFDLVPVSSEFEAEHKRAWGIHSNKLRITGIARLDELLELSARSPWRHRPRTILFMPTVREWLAGRQSRLESSRFLAEVLRFLSDSELTRVMAEHDVRMSVFVHPAMTDHVRLLLNNLGLSNIEVLPPGADLQQELVSCSLFITDYSSVAWDALYIRRPVMFYQFDAEEHAAYRGRGAHIDFSRGLFGPIAHTPAAAVAAVRDYIRSDFSYLGFDESCENWRKRAFVHVDTNNRRRVMAEIVSQLQARGRSRAWPTCIGGEAG